MTSILILIFIVLLGYTSYRISKQGTEVSKKEILNKVKPGKEVPTQKVVVQAKPAVKDDKKVKAKTKK